MGFRVVDVSSRCKLEASLGYLVCLGEQEKRIYFDEIATIIVSSTAVSMTAHFLSECSKRNIALVFCNEKSLPESVLLPINGNYANSQRLGVQVRWDTLTKDRVWQEIISMKICRQAEVLNHAGLGSFSAQLLDYTKEILPGDVTNREGFAAKVYFNALFGEGFSRDQPLFVNGCLNYGYAIAMATVAREIVANGYSTQLGIKHSGAQNPWNLACDFMEPLRPFVDDKAKGISANADMKEEMLRMFVKDVKIGDMITSFDNAIRIMVRSFLSALEGGDTSIMKAPLLYEP